jgi:RNA polymerase sigma-70 factor (ECF subfamily)
MYRETVHPLFGYMARRTGGNRQLTEDIVQESYLRALNTWTHKAIPDSSLAWLKRVARNILVDYLRQRKKESGVDLDTIPEAGSVGSADRIKSLETFIAISSLGRKKAEIIEAFYYEGKSAREIAQAKNISERAVEGHLRRARQSLKSLLPVQKTKGGSNE